MVSRVIYRPFEESDFPALSSILLDAWHSDSPSKSYNALEAAYDLAHALSVSTFSQVVLVDDAPRGVVMASVHGDEVPRAQQWKRLQKGILTQMRELDAELTESYLAFLEHEKRVNGLLLKKSGMSLASEVTLLAVENSARGLGIGSVLLDAAASYAASRGAHDAYLYTDTDCSWKFYERRGLKRAASYRPTREERKLLPREMYLYGLDLSA